MKEVFKRRLFQMMAAVLFCGALSSAKEPAQEKPPSRARVVETIDNVGQFISKNIESSVGNIRLQVRGVIGSFQISVMNDAGAAVPLLSGHDEFTSSFFSLRAGSREYKLADNLGIVVGARKSEAGAQLVYIVPNVARVLVKFDCISSVQGEPEDVLRITATVLNRGRRADTFALKAVLDTVLGELTGTHFSTAQDLAVNSEMQFRTPGAMRWICSKNERAAMRIMVYGADCSPVEAVSLGNKDLLALPVWIPSASSAKTFDSVLSYNNSAVCINWHGARLSPGEEASFVYYISMAADGLEPAGDRWLSAFPSESKADGAFAADSNSNGSEVKGGGGNEAFRERIYVQFDVEPSGVERLNYEYIQSLIDRIDSMESGGDFADRAELLRLNAELDEILERLRRQ